MDESADVSRRALLRGVAGATAASTAAGTAAAQEGEGEGGEGGEGGGGQQRPVRPDYLGDANDQGYEDHRGESAVTIEVGAGGDGLAFGPTLVWVDEGTEVTWEWTGEGGAHNVVANSGAEFNSGSAVDNEGETFTQTIEEGGMVEYYCSPHESLGMKGAVAVGEGVETETVGGGSAGPQVPDAAKSLGVAAGFAMAATLGLAYFFIKYGGDYGGADAA